MSKEIKYTIGKKRSCDIVLNEDTVSGIHAEIIFTNDNKIYLCDKNSLNGTFLLTNKKFKKIQNIKLSPTDVVRFGLCEIAAKELFECIHMVTSLRKPDNDTKLIVKILKNTYKITQKVVEFI